MVWIDKYTRLEWAVSLLVLYPSPKREWGRCSDRSVRSEMSQFGPCLKTLTRAWVCDVSLNLHNAKRSVILLQQSYTWQFKFLCSIHRISTTVDTLSSSFFHVSSPIVQYNFQPTKCILENSQILPHNRSPPSNGFVSYWLTPATGDCSSCAWKMLNKQRAIGQKFYGMNVLVVSNNLDADRGYLMGIYGYRKDNTKPFVKYHGSHGGKKPCNPWATKAIALNISILAFTRRMGGSPLSMGAHEVLIVIGIAISHLWLSRSLTLDNWIRSWLSTISPIRQ